MEMMRSIIALRTVEQVAINVSAVFSAITKAMRPIYVFLRQAIRLKAAIADWEPLRQ
jgi:hypothetical protein